MKRKMMYLLLLSLLVSLAMVMATLSSCSKDEKESSDDDDNDVTGKDDDDSNDDDDNDNDTDDDNDDNDDVVENPTDKLCQSDSGCPDGYYCDPETKKCAEGIGCSEDYQCPGQPLAYCDQEKGLCREFKMLCEECQQDSDCGFNPDLSAEYPNKCIDLGTGLFCGWNHGNMACPPGFTDASNKGLTEYDGQCIPQSYGSEEAGDICSNRLCETDEDCPYGLHCVGVFQGYDDMGEMKLMSLCTDACIEDSDCTADQYCNYVVGLCTAKCDPYENNGMSNCGTGKACHLDGRCGDACPDDQFCTDRFGDTYTADLICEQPQGRCRISGCERDADCGSALGIYCDTESHECIVGCRTNEDCPSMMICVDKGFAGTPDYEANYCTAPPCDCVPPPCTTKGGNIFCGTFQFCCSENPDIKCPEGINDGECYPAPIPPYCAQCDPDAEDPCPEGDPPGGYDGNCYELQDQDGNKIGNYCANVCRDDLDCPTQVKCTEVEIDGKKEKICDFSKCEMKNPPEETGGTTP